MSRRCGRPQETAWEPGLEPVSASGLDSEQEWLSEWEPGWRLGSSLRSASQWELWCSTRSPRASSRHQLRIPGALDRSSTGKHAPDGSGYADAGVVCRL